MIKQESARDKLKESFLSLLKTHDLKDIKVQDICKLSGFHRSTFYLYYHRIDDLVQDLFEDIFEQIDPSCCKYLRYRNVEFNGGMPPCELIRSKREYLPVFQDEALSLYFTNLAMTRFLPCAKSWLVDAHENGDEQLAYGLLSFLFHGCVFGAVSTIDFSDEAWAEIRSVIDEGINLKMERTRVTHFAAEQALAAAALD